MCPRCQSGRILLIESYGCVPTPTIMLHVSYSALDLKTVTMTNICGSLNVVDEGLVSFPYISEVEGEQVPALS